MTSDYDKKMIEKLGSPEAYEAWKKNRSSKGGKMGGKNHFVDRQKAGEAGKKGMAKRWSKRETEQAE